MTRKNIAVFLIVLLCACITVGCAERTDSGEVIYDPVRCDREFVSNFNIFSPTEKISPDVLENSRDIELESMSIHLTHFEETYYGAICTNTADYSLELKQKFLEEGKYVLLGMRGNLTEEEAASIIEEVSQGDPPTQGFYVKKYDFAVSYYVDETRDNTFYLCVRDYVSGIDD